VSGAEPPVGVFRVISHRLSKNDGTKEEGVSGPEGGLVKTKNCLLVEGARCPDHFADVQRVPLSARLGDLGRRTGIENTGRERAFHGDDDRGVRVHLGKRS
jgi:hypothetical protein